VALDSEVAMGQGRSFFRVVDLLELTSFVEHLAAEARGKHVSKT
jgi:hypothetical protein